MAEALDILKEELEQAGFRVGADGSETMNFFSQFGVESFKTLIESLRKYDYRIAGDGDNQKTVKTVRPGFPSLTFSHPNLMVTRKSFSQKMAES